MNEKKRKIRVPDRVDSREYLKHYALYKVWENIIIAKDLRSEKKRCQRPTTQSPVRLIQR